MTVHFAGVTQEGLFFPFWVTPFPTISHEKEVMICFLILYEGF